MGKSSMEELIIEETRQLCEKLDNDVNQPIKINLTFNLSVVNALWTVVTGSRLSLDDPKLIKLVARVDELMQMSSSVSLVNMIPSSRFVIPDLSGWTKTKEIMGNLIDFLSVDVKDHQVNFEAKKEILREQPNDFIDAFLAKTEDSPVDRYDENSYCSWQNKTFQQ